LRHRNAARQSNRLPVKPGGCRFWLAHNTAPGVAACTLAAAPIEEYKS